MAQRKTLQYRNRPRGVLGGLVLNLNSELDLQTHIGRGGNAQITGTLELNNRFVVNGMLINFAFLGSKGSTKTPK